MLRLCSIILALVFSASAAQAQIAPYIYGETGLAETDFDNTVLLAAGAGVRFTESVHMELGYNNYGEIGNLNVDFSSWSLGIKWVQAVNESMSVHGIIGVEDLKAEGSFSFGSFGVDIDESSNEVFLGIGASFGSSEKVRLRTQLLAHDSSDLITLRVGVQLGF